MKSTFSVIFYLKRQAVKKDGTVPVMGRITVDGTQTQFSSKLSVDPKLWDTKGGRVTGRSSAALETNRLLDKMRVSINRHYPSGTPVLCAERPANGGRNARREGVQRRDGNAVFRPALAEKRERHTAGGRLPEGGKACHQGRERSDGTSYRE